MESPMASTAHARQQDDLDFHQSFLRRFFDLPGVDTPRRDSCTRSSIIHDLKDNNRYLQELKLSSVHALVDFHQLCAAIASNNTVRSARIHGFFVEKLPAMYQQKLWEAIGNLPQLEELHLNYFLDFQLTTEVISYVLNRAKTLNTLSIHDSEISGKYIKLCLKDHTALRGIYISQLYLSDEVDSLDPLIQAFASAPNLLKLNVRMAHRQRHLLSIDTIDLLSTKGFQELELRKIVLNNDGVIKLTKSLRQQQHGKIISISLRELVVECETHLHEEICAAVGDMLENNQTLERLELWSKSIDENGVRLIAEKLKRNRKLRAIMMTHGNISRRSQEALVSMLKQNLFLEHMRIESCDNEELLATIEFYLKLNSTCLRRLMLNINASREQIFDKLVVHSKNLNYTFHVLRGNPSFLIVD